ncbi:MAG: ferredoxin [Alphaproteobacteria bacterium CG_4_10_14_0_8_um_filter_53_9]|nr:MAG: ferredoxin [Alphaproteobacteria bacterium CG_4_10_14_0_8_um_filter_53_9]
MPFVVTGKCIKCRYTDCVEVCPVDCFYQGENMLVINPDECIDCGVCEPECPIEAIKSDEELTSDEMHWADINQKFSALWPQITESVGPMPEAETFSDQSSSEKKALFSEKAGEQ